MLNPQVIGQAESALGAILDPILASTQTTFSQWLVLTVSTGGGGTVDKDQLVCRIASARKMDPALVDSAIRDLTAAGLIAAAPADGQPEGHALLELTAPGRARFQQIRSRIDEITKRVFDLPASDLEVAGRVLSTVTERANAEIAAARTS